MRMFGHNASILPGVVCPLMIKAALSKPFPAKIIEDTSTNSCLLFSASQWEARGFVSGYSLWSRVCVYALAVMKMSHVFWRSKCVWADSSADMPLPVNSEENAGTLLYKSLLSEIERRSQKPSTEVSFPDKRCHRCAHVSGSVCECMHTAVLVSL